MQTRSTNNVDSARYEPVHGSIGFPPTNPTPAIYKLSEDCLLEIFRIIRPVAPSHLSCGEFYCRTLLLERLRTVCKRWREVLDSRPSFWNVIFLSMRSRRSIGESLRFLRRSGTAPMYMFIGGGLISTPSGLDHPYVVDLMENLRGVSPRIKYLKFLDPDPPIYRLFWPVIQHAATSSIQPPPLVALESITVLSLHLRDQNYTHKQLIELFGQIPHLLTLSLSDLLKEDDYESSTASLPCLQELRLVVCRRRILDLLEYPSQTTVKVWFPAYRLPYRDQSARDEIFRNFFPLSFSQSTMVSFTVTEGGSTRSELAVYHEDTPTGRGCYIHLILGHNYSRADVHASFRFATHAVKNLESVDTICLNIHITPLPGSLVQWMAGFLNLQVLKLAGSHISQVLIDLFFADVNRLPRLRRITLENACSLPVTIQLERWLAARKREQRLVELEYHT